MFESIREFANALMEGRKFLRDGYTYFFDENEGFSRWHQIHGRTSMSYSDFLYFDSDNLEEIIEPKWYENIPEHGILCKVRIRPHDMWSTDIITSFTGLQGCRYPYHSRISNTLYKEAIPLTKEEALEFIYEGTV